MRIRNKLYGGAAFALFCAAGLSQVDAATPCAPKVEGPVAATASSKIYEPTSNPYANPTPPAGEMAEEFFVSCTAASGPYKTLVHVTLPTDPAKQSGIVIAEPWHRGDFWTIYDKARKYITRAGHVSAIIVADPYVLNTYMKKAEPARYASLTIPGKTDNQVKVTGQLTPEAIATESEILSQVGSLIKNGGLPGIKPRKIILGGMSQTGGVTRNYILWEHAKPGAKSAYDGYFPQQARTTFAIPDLDVPVVEMQGEREVVGIFERGETSLEYRRPDGPLYRLYEVPGSPHIATRMATQITGPVPTNRIEPGVAECVGHPWTNFPTDMLYAASLDALVQWVDKGVPAPHVPRMDTSADGRVVHRDTYGNALGGFRTSYLDVPIATYHATWGNYVTTPKGPSDAMAAKCDQIGWTAPLPAVTLKKLYPTHADYVAKVKADTVKLVATRQLLPDDAAALNGEAAKANVP